MLILTSFVAMQLYRMVTRDWWQINHIHTGCLIHTLQIVHAARLNENTFNFAVVPISDFCHIYADWNVTQHNFGDFRHLSLHQRSNESLTLYEAPIMVLLWHILDMRIVKYESIHKIFDAIKSFTFSSTATAATRKTVSNEINILETQVQHSDDPLLDVIFFSLSLLKFH